MYVCMSISFFQHTKKPFKGSHVFFLLFTGSYSYMAKQSLQGKLVIKQQLNISVQHFLVELYR